MLTDIRYADNTHRWMKGDIVIHRVDDKEPKNLMKVIGYTRDGQCKTQYCDPHRRNRFVTNDLKYLLEPESFGLHAHWGLYAYPLLEQVQGEWERVRKWNRKHRVGITVYTTSADGDFETTTRSSAKMTLDGSAQILLDHGGWWSLRHLEVAREAPAPIALTEYGTIHKAVLVAAVQYKTITTMGLQQLFVVNGVQATRDEISSALYDLVEWGKLTKSVKSNGLRPSKRETWFEYSLPDTDSNRSVAG